jgi:hypothetical protein
MFIEVAVLHRTTVPRHPEAANSEKENLDELWRAFCILSFPDGAV